MSTATLNLTEGAFSEGLDSIVIRHYLAGYQKGTVLDVESFTPEVIKAGHLVLRDKNTGRLEPLSVVNGAYATTVPPSREFAGFTVATVRKSLPIVGVMYAGEINDKCMPFAIPEALKAQVKSDLPQIVFAHD